LGAGRESKAVFLSYASEDSEPAQRIASALKSAGIEVWIDQSELRGGDAWDASRRRQIRTCALFLPLISSRSDARLEGYFRRAWKLAADRTHDMAAGRPFLVPVVIDATREAAAHVPEEFRIVQWMRLPDAVPSAQFVARIAGLAGGNALPAAHVSSSAVPSSPSRQPRAWIVAGAALALAVLGVAGWLRHRGTPPPAPQPQSVAVLPFADLSEQRDQELFADGLAEEVRDLLAQVPDLKVSARTSSFYFKGRQTTTPEIARVLGVAHLLEGSVRRAADRIRVAVELVRADSGYRAWSQHYDRDIGDIFAVQAEIATAAVTALKLRLSPAAAPASATAFSRSARAAAQFAAAISVIERTA